MTSPGSTVEEGRFRGEPCLTLTAGQVTATFLPDLGMTGVSLRFDGHEHLALPGGLPALRAGRSLGLPLLAPWANRLGSRHYRAGRVDVDLTGIPLHLDSNGLPIHGFLLGSPGWRVDRCSARRGRAGFRAQLDVDGPAFPFPHRLEIQVSAHERELTVGTTLVPTGRRRVPVTFGWHPYLRLPGSPRGRWRLELPARTEEILDDRSLPSGKTVARPSEAAPIRRRTFDDLYRLGRDRRLAVVGPDGASLAVRVGRGYRFAQVWVPAGRSFVALEPMTSSINSLGDGTAPLVGPGDSFRATFALALGEPA